MHHGFDWPLTPFLSISLWGLAVTNQDRADCDSTLSQGPSPLPWDLSHPVRRTPQFLHPSSSRKKNPQGIRGGVVRTSPRAPSRTSFSPPQRLWEPRCPAPAHLTTLRPRHSVAGGPRTRMSEVHWVPEAEPPPRRPSLHLQEGSSRRTGGKRCGVPDSLAEGRILPQAPSPPRDSVPLQGGRGRQRDAGTGPRRPG